MDEPEKTQTKSGANNRNQETLHLLNVFPELVWQIIFDKLNNAADYHKLCQSFPVSHPLFSEYRTNMLFGNVVEVMINRLENREGNQEHNLQLPNLVSLRRICKFWKRGVDSHLQNLTSNYNFSTEYKLPRSQFEKDMDHKYGYRFIQADDYEKFLRHFESTHGAAGVNPFITRRLTISIQLDRTRAIDPQLDLLSSTCLDMLRIDGKHVRYLHFEAAMTEQRVSVNPVRIFNFLKKILKHLPNLQVLRIKPPLNVLIQHEVHQVTEAGNSLSLVNTRETYFDTARHTTYRRLEPVLRLRRLGTVGEEHILRLGERNFVLLAAAGNLGEYLIVNNPQAANNPAQQVPLPPDLADPQAERLRHPVVQNILQNFFMRGLLIPEEQINMPQPLNPIPGVPEPLNNPLGDPGLPDLTKENFAVPVLPYLRFVDQGQMPFNFFMELIRPNINSLTQLGVKLSSREDCSQFWDLPLKLAKLEINLSELDMPWIEVFPFLHIYCTNLESLHIYLPKSTILCPLRLPNLKVLHLLLDTPVPLDFLRGMSDNLEELYVKIGHMNREENAHVQENERRILFYKHLDQLTDSNIWTEFPQLRNVRVSSHVEIENMTPFWQCTVDEWKSLNK